MDLQFRSNMASLCRKRTYSKVMEIMVHREDVFEANLSSYCSTKDNTDDFGSDSGISAPSSPESESRGVPDSVSPFSSAPSTPATCRLDDLSDIEFMDLNFNPFDDICKLDGDQLDIEDFETNWEKLLPSVGKDCTDCGSTNADKHLDFCVNSSQPVAGSKLNTVLFGDPVVGQAVNNIPDTYPWKLSNIFPINDTSSLNSVDKLAFTSTVDSAVINVEDDLPTPYPHTDHCYGNVKEEQEESKSSAETVESGDEEIDVVGLPDEAKTTTNTAPRMVQPVSSLPASPLPTKKTLKRPYSFMSSSPVSRKVSRCLSEDELADQCVAAVLNGAELPTGEKKLKRSQHNHLERQRRNDIKDLFMRLRNSVPSTSTNPRASKLNILKAARVYINECNLVSGVLERQERELKLRRMKLMQQMAKHPEGRKLLNLRKHPNSLLQ